MEHIIIKKTFTGTLEKIDYKYNGSPSIIVVGNVVNYHREFQTVENREYSGKTISIFYDFYIPPLNDLESKGFTVFKIKESQVLPVKIDVHSLSGKNIAIEGRYVQTFFDGLISNKFDLRRTGKIATDEIGKELLKKYGIFDVVDILKIDGSYIKFGHGNSREIDVGKLEKNNFNGYIEDYLDKSDLIVLAGKSESLPDEIKISERIPVIRIEYPYDGMEKKIVSFFGEVYEKN